MNSGELHAWHYATRKPTRVTWSAGRIVSLSEVAEKAATDIWVAPPLLDLQINGYAGVDFQQDDVTEEESLRAVRALRRDGCAKFFLTLITDEWRCMMSRLRHYCELRRNNPELQGAILGFHIEGPFLSPQPGFCGAHDPALMINPTRAHIRELMETVGEIPLLLTIAPEWPGSHDAIVEARKSGCHVNIGHTDATREQLTLALSCGAFAFTHLANGCPQSLDRHDNILWRALDLDELWVSLIPDGHHVSPQLFRIIHRLTGENIYYTTDAMSAAGAGPGKYRLGKLELEVKDDGVVRYPGKTNFAGSSLTPIAGVFNAAEMLRQPWQEVWKFFAEIPAKRIGWDNTLAAGHEADFCVLEFPAGDEKLRSEEGLKLTTYVGGTPFPGRAHA